MNEDILLSGLFLIGVGIFFLVVPIKGSKNFDPILTDIILLINRNHRPQPPTKNELNIIKIIGIINILLGVLLLFFGYLNI